VRGFSSEYYEANSIDNGLRLKLSLLSP